jgi:hypothetical protein
MWAGLVPPKAILSLCPHVFPVCVCVLTPSSYKDPGQVALGPPLEPCFNLITSLKTLSPNWVTFEAVGAKDPYTRILGSTVQPIN